jgi:hypothetical protein
MSTELSLKTERACEMCYNYAFRFKVYLYEKCLAFSLILSPSVRSSIFLWIYDKPLDMCFISRCHPEPWPKTSKNRKRCDIRTSFYCSAPLYVKEFIVFTQDLLKLCGWHPYCQWSCRHKITDRSISVDREGSWNVNCWIRLCFFLLN